jgi:hypothetical protein
MTLTEQFRDEQGETERTRHAVEAVPEDTTTEAAASRCRSAVLPILRDDAGMVRARDQAGRARSHPRPPWAVQQPPAKALRIWSSSWTSGG